MLCRVASSSDARPPTGFPVAARPSRSSTSRPSCLTLDCPCLARRTTSWLACWATSSPSRSPPRPHRVTRRARSTLREPWQTSSNTSKTIARPSDLGSSPNSQRNGPSRSRPSHPRSTLPLSLHQSRQDLSLLIQSSPCLSRILLRRHLPRTPPSARPLHRTRTRSRQRL